MNESPCKCPWHHDWTVENESFDHELGTEVAVRWICSKCGKETSIQPEIYL